MSVSLGKNQETPSLLMSATFLAYHPPVWLSPDHATKIVACGPFFSAFKAILIATVPIGICNAEWLLPDRPETAPLRLGTAASPPRHRCRKLFTCIIPSIILLVLIVAAVGGGGLILALR